MTLDLAERPVTRHPAVIEASLNYLGLVEGRLFTYTFEPPAGQPRSNIEAAPHRTASPSTTYGRSPDRSRWTARASPWRRAPARCPASTTRRRAARSPTPRAPASCGRPGAARVNIFDHTIRRQSPGAEDRAGGARQPLARIHVDHTEWSGPQRVHDLLPEEAEALLRSRVQIVNIWRPIVGPVRDMPLAVCDTTTVAPADLVEATCSTPTDAARHIRRGSTRPIAGTGCQR